MTFLPVKLWLVALVAASFLPWYAGSSVGLGSSLVALGTAGHLATAPLALAVLALVALGLAGSKAPAPAAVLGVALVAIAWVLLSGGLGISGGDAYDPELPLTLQNQPSLGFGAYALLVALLGIVASGMARAGVMDGDVFGTHLLVGIAAVLFLFILIPLLQIFTEVLRPDGDGSVAAGFLGRVFNKSVWGLDCLAGGRRCGMAWNSIGLGLAVGTSCTVLGLAAALFVSRTRVRGRGPIRLLSLLPLVTPPFVVGLALILLFGRSGVATLFMDDWFGIRPTRWIYGPQGIWLAQTLGLSPLAFMVIHSVLVSVSPSVEEASATLRASRAYTFRTVTLPLIRPGLANAFLLCFIESLADLGNPLVIGGGFRVLASGIYFKIVGAQADLGDAAGLGVVLLCISLLVFVAQNYWLRGASYVTVTGKGDGGRSATLPMGVRIPVIVLTLLWVGLILAVYGSIVLGSFAEIWGRDFSFTLRHYVDAFEVTSGEHGLVWSGGAWNSFTTTIWIAAIAAPATAALGLLTAYLIARRQFVGRGAFEFVAMLSFAMPGTVVGLAYVLAFNAPPIEITGTAAILFFAFISRNMPVGVRVGLAQLSQIDKSLDEASFTLGAGPTMTLRRVLYPLLKPAVATAVIYAFVSAVTTLSQVIFLVSPRYDWATTYIVGLVENANYGRAIAYSVVLIILLVVVIALLQLILAQVTTGRRGPTTELPGEQ